MEYRSFLRSFADRFQKAVKLSLLTYVNEVEEQSEAFLQENWRNCKVKLHIIVEEIASELSSVAWEDGPHHVMLTCEHLKVDEDANIPITFYLPKMK